MPSILNYKYGNHLVVEVRDCKNEKLCGYVAFRKKTGLIDDILADNPAHLTAVLSTALNLLVSEPDLASQFELSYIQAMMTPFLQETLYALDFKPIRFMFAFICDGLDQSLPPEATNPQMWYLTPGD